MRFFYGNIFRFLIILISSFAITQYFLNKSDQRKTAATIVYNQLKDFDEYVENIENAKNRILDTFVTTNNAKSFALQYQVIENLKDKNVLADIKELSDAFNKSSIYFSMRLPYDVLKNMVDNYNKMSGTITLERLRELSYKNKR